MNWRAGAFALIISGSLLGQQIHMKTRSIPTIAGTPITLPDNHQIVVFDHSPSVEDLDTLLAAGAQVVGVLPDNAVVVGSASGAVTPGNGILWTGRLDPADKLSPSLSSDGNQPVIVEFHSDVSADVQVAIATEEGVALQRPPVLLALHAIAVAPFAALQALAAHDEVAYMFPADPALLTDAGFSACAGMLTMAGPIAQYSNLVHGWDLNPDHVAHLGYVFGSLTTKVPAAQVESAIVRALNEWSNYTNVAFAPGTSATAARTVLVKFASGSHGDAYPFDGPGGILAHTFYPVPVNPESVAGDMHLDADEDWHNGSTVDVYSVALHEAGHAIGLGHTDNPGDVMYPYYRLGMALSANDIGAAQALYGKPLGAPVTISAAKPLQITADAVPSSVQSASVAATGTLSGGTAPYSVQWQTDHGYSGQASLAGSESWNTGPVPLVNGENTITVTAYDSATGTATQTETVSLVPASKPSGTAAPVSVLITSPASSVATVNAATVSLAGTAAGGAGISKVTWQTSTGAAGTATGTTHWLATAVPLLKGTNTLVIRAYDATGNSAWAALVVIRNY